MNRRIKELRELSLNSIEKISSERALLITEFYKLKNKRNLPVIIQRAKFFEYLMSKKKLYFDKNELIVGERGPIPKATPTYPEICLHSLDDLKILNDREKVSFLINDKTKKDYEEKIIPFWKNNTIRDLIFSEMDNDWKKAYDSGVFTEFLEQRAPGHTVLGDKIYKLGMKDIIAEIDKNLEKLDYFDDRDCYEKRNQLQAMKITAKALINYAQRYSKLILQKAQKEKDPSIKTQLFRLSEICKKVPAEKPSSFREALQYYWFVHIGVISELNPWDSFNPGRIDQHLFPFYKNDIEKKIITKDEATELLECLWIKFNNQPSPPKIGVTAQESNTYTDFALLNLGGVKADGSNAVNDLTYLILDVIKEMRLLQPSSMIQVSKVNPDGFIKRSLKIIKTGFGQPSVFNSDAIVKELLSQGKSLEDARNGGASGCVEAGAFGKESYILTGYFNLTKILELTIHNGWDPIREKQIGLKTGEFKKFKSFSDFYNAFEKQLRYFVDIKIKGNNIISKIYSQNLPVPFLSLLIDDCLKNNKDYNAGGARYKTRYIQGVGLGTITDSLTSIKYHIFDKKSISKETMFRSLKNNFSDKSIRKILRENTPKFGNDIEYADNISKKIFNSFYQAVNNRPTYLCGKYRINLLPTTIHVYFGSVLGATPDGRKAFQPISEGISPVQGMDVNGPTAVIKSVSKIDHIKTGGTLLNQKFSPDLFQRESDIFKITKLIRTYFKMDGHHIQFNVVNAQILKNAQKNPEKHQNLIVRVAGYSDYFNALSKDLQNEIIKRTEHDNF